MKKIIVALFLCIMAQAYGQKNEIWVSYGAFGYEYAPKYTKMPHLDPTEVAFWSTLRPCEPTTFGELTIGYGRNIFSWLTVTASYSYTNSRRDFANTIVDRYSNLAHFSQGVHDVMLGVKFTWLRVKKFSFYSRAAMGVRIFGKAHKVVDRAADDIVEQNVLDLFNVADAEHISHKTHLAWQTSFAGVQWNPVKPLGIFVEGGLGSEGKLIAGVRFGF